MKSSYYDLLKDPRWQRKRLEVLERDAFTCTCCGDQEKELHVHHRYYVQNRSPWAYPNFALVTLCIACHEDIRNGIDELSDWELAAGALSVDSPLVIDAALELEKLWLRETTKSRASLTIQAIGLLLNLYDNDSNTVSIP